MRSILLVVSLLSINAHADTCKASFLQTTGTHWKPVTTQKTNVGEGLLVKGRVLSARDCSPIAHAKISHWQSGADNEYHDRLRAYLFSNDNGEYKFNTEFPGMRHIHFIVKADGFQELSTQWIWKHQGNGANMATKPKHTTFNIVLRPLSDQIQ